VHHPHQNVEELVEEPRLLLDDGLYSGFTTTSRTGKDQPVAARKGKFRVEAMIVWEMGSY
jgi:hypothetical protein